MASTLNQPLKWHSGKNYLARRIVALMPPHLNYVEPYFGGGAVLCARDPDDRRLWLPPHQGVSEIVNDLNSDLTNFWQVLRHGSMFAEFRRMAEATPFSGIEYADAAAMLGAGNLREVERAWAFFVVNRQSLAGPMAGLRAQLELDEPTLPPQGTRTYQEADDVAQDPGDAAEEPGVEDYGGKGAGDDAREG